MSFDDPRPQNTQQQVLPRGPTSQPYRTPVRIRRSDGRREVWREGEGYVPDNSLEAIPNLDAQDLQAARGALATSARNVQLGEQFLEANRTPRRNLVDAGGETGGWAALPVPEWSGLQNETRQRMEGLTNQMVRANIRPGQAGTMNSLVEQMMARQQYPSPEAPGNINGDRILSMLVDNDEMAAMVQAAEQWAQRHGSLSGFAVDWTQNQSRAVRARAEDAHARRLGLRRVIPQSSRPEAMGQGGQQPQQQIRRISNAAEYQQIPSGTEYIDPSGTRRRKP